MSEEGQTSMGTEMLERHCRRLGWHEAHIHETRGGQFRCPGIAHDHEALCCTLHQHHVMPHRGCILR